MVTFDMVKIESFVVENISTFKADVFTLVEDNMLKGTFTVILTILAGKIPARLEFLIVNFFAVYV